MIGKIDVITAHFKDKTEYACKEEDQKEEEEESSKNMFRFRQSDKGMWNGLVKYRIDLN